MPETKFIGERPQIVPSLPESKSGLSSQHVEHLEDVHKPSYISGLSIWPKSDPSIDLRTISVRPFLFCLNPIIIWASLVYVAQEFGQEPYNFNSIAQGLVFLSPFVGSLFATAFCGRMVDKIVGRSTRRNNGVREPEMRLFALVVAAVITIAGSIVTALCLQYRVHYMGPIVGFGILTVSNQIGVNMGMSYPLDCYPQSSPEVMVSVTFLRSLVTWAWSWFINDWLTASGPLVVFLSMGAIQVAIQLSCLIFFKWGKALRTSLYQRHILGA
ncbi:hypothetical protein HAV15_012067 [Penicillium sp. str. |nr:hypothetical protein HAV15_012067 [Penicillium sp. str. \